MKQLVEYIAKALVDYPEQVDVQQVEGEHTVILEIRVAPDDMGKIIGKKGRIAKAIRTVVGAAALKDNKRIMVEIIDCGVSGAR